MDASAAIAGVRTVQSALQVLTALGLFKDLWPKNAAVSDGDKYDFIIVGGGTAGCVLANRLTEDNVTRVLLIEAGGDPPIESVRPGLLLFLKQSKVDWNYTSEDDAFTERFHKNHIVELTRGKMLGGCSSLNFMEYTRGNYHDYNGWARITNDTSWCWKNVIPYFKKSENMLSRRILDSKYKKFHGVDGYMKVTKPHYKLLDDYLNAFKEVGNSVVEDTSGVDPLGYKELAYNVAGGKRQGTALAFLSTAKDRDNLHVLKNALATKIIFDKNSAIGVKVALGNKTIKVYAQKEVIVSAGVINTPQFLMLSGVGPKMHLKRHNIPIIADLPVGQTLQDHVMVMVIHKIKPLPREVVPSLNPDEFSLPWFEGFVALNKSQGYPDYQTLNVVLQDPEALLQLCAFYYSYVDELCQELYDMGKGFELMFSFVLNLYPKSRGQVLLQSTNPHVHPRIYTGYYSNPDDLEKHAKLLQHFLNISKSHFFKDNGAEMLVPKICGCSQSDINEYLKCYALCMMVSGYHYSGSAPMGTVLDSRLRVYGVKNLRVVDASVMPKITGANTHAPTVMIGEKAADMIKEDYGLL